MLGSLLASGVSVQASEAPSFPPLVQSQIGVLATLLTVLAVIFWAQQNPAIGRIFKVVPALVFCYFVPTLLSALNVIPSNSELYKSVKEFVLPASLLLLTLALDIKGIIRLGPKAGIMLLTGTFGVIIGAPIALFIWQGLVPDDAWKPLAYLAGSWIGGGANAVALQKSFEVSDAAVAPIIVVDVAVSNVWMSALLYLAARHAKVDAWLRADASAITQLERKMADFQAQVARTPSIGDFLIVLALGFFFAWVAHLGGMRLVSIRPFSEMQDYIGAFAWKVIIVTAFGMLLSQTRARDLEGVGASKIGGVMIYLLVACIGAGADFNKLSEALYYLVVGATWMLIHIGILLIVARLIRAPFFFVAVGSKANIGGAASAPVVASAFNPVLAPVGALLAIAGYVMGTVGGLICVWLCRFVLGAL